LNELLELEELIGSKAINDNGGFGSIVV